MIITSPILFYQLSKKIDFVEKRSPSHKLQIDNVRFYNGKTEVGSCYLVDCRRLDKAIVAKKPITLILINAEDLDRSYIPKNCDYAIFKNVRNFFDLAEMVYEAINDLQNWDCKLKDALTSRIPLDEFGAIAKDIIKEPLYVLNHNFSFLSLTGKKSYAFISDDEINENADNAIYKSNFGKVLSIKAVRRLLIDKEYASSQKYTDIYTYEDPNKELNLCQNIISDGRYIARLMSPVTIYNGIPDEGQMQLFRHYFHYLSHVYLRYSEDPLIKRKSDKLHTLIYDMITTPNMVDITDASLILQNYGWSLNDTYSIINFAFYKNTKWDELTEYISGKFEETWSNSCAIVAGDDIILILNHSISKNLDDEHKFFHVLAYIVRDFVCKAGVSDSFEGLNKISSYLLQARKALEIGQKCSANKWYFKFSDYALDYMYDRIISEFSYDQLISEAIRKLIEYDLKNNTEYLKTLEVYLQNNCNSTHTAEELYIHRTTLIRRIERIEEITKINFNDSETRIYLILSFWILEKLGFKASKLHLK